MNAIQFDVSGLQFEARRAALEAAPVYWRHTRQWFIGLECFGSAVKGGIIPGASDIDFHIYLEDAAFTPQGTVPFELAVAIHRDLVHLDTAPFRYLDGGFEPAFIPAGHVGPVPGAYHMLAGRLPVSEATSDQLKQQAYETLGNLNPIPLFVSENLFRHGGGQGNLALTVRRVCQAVWPVLFHVLALQQVDALTVWRTDKIRAVEMLPAKTSPGRAIRTFYPVMRRYYPTEAPAELGLEVITAGVRFLQTAKAWFEGEA